VQALREFHPGQPVQRRTFQVHQHHRFLDHQAVDRAELARDPLFDHVARPEEI
jgi:hypothetical protein